MLGTLTTRPPARIEVPASDQVQNQELDSLRMAHLKTESVLKGLGIYFLLGAAAFFVAGTVHLTEVIRQIQQGSSEFFSLTVAGILMVALPAFMIQTGIKLRKLCPSAKKQATIMGILGLALYPLGSILNLVVLFLIDSPKAEHAEVPIGVAVSIGIISATPLAAELIANSAMPL